MKKLFILLPVFAVIIFVAAFCAPPKDKGIVFIEDNWQDAVNKAKAEHKLIFLDISATWCGPCQMLKKETFTNKRVGEYYNAHFVNVALDGEAGDGAKLAGKLNLQAYPSLYILDTDGHVVSASVGYMSAKELVRFGKQVINDK